MYVSVPSGYNCYVRAMDIFGTMYYQSTGFMNHLPSPENLIKEENNTIDLGLYKAAKLKGVL